MNSLLAPANPVEQVSLSQIARQLTTGGRGVLAADESIKTMSSRLEAEGIPASESARRDYRQLLLTAANLADSVSGIIFADETFGQRLSTGEAFPEATRARGILPGIKVDTGTTALPHGNGALITEGLDGLGPRLADYAERGAAFAKWRAVFDVHTITPYAARANGHALARYAALCQARGIVPIVEPEVLCTGGHDLNRSAEASRLALGALFAELQEAQVDLAGVVLKPNFVTPGLDAADASPRAVAEATYEVLSNTVPSTVGGIAFLSGGHSTANACAYLSALSEIEHRPWPMTFSFGRALVSAALRAWSGNPANLAEAQERLRENCEFAATASLQPRTSATHRQARHPAGSR